MRALITAVGVVFFALLALVGGAVGLVYLAEGESTWADLSLPKQRRVRILCARSSDTSAHAVYSEFSDSGAVVAPKFFIGTHFSLRPPFVVVPSVNEDLVAVAMQDKPKALVTIFDFATGARWPGGNGQEENQVAQALLMKMRKVDAEYRLYDWDIVENLPFKD